MDPDQGPVEAFASDLRMLKKKAGNPSYRVLAQRTHYSHTVLSDAARGDRLPTLAVTEAFVQACGGHPEEWRAKWHAYHQRTALDDRFGDTTAPQRVEAVEPDSAHDAQQSSPPDRRILSRRRLVMLLIAVLIAVASASAGWAAARQAPHADPAPPPIIQDGVDPTLARCTKLAQLLSTDEVRLSGPADLGGRQLGAGQSVGTIQLWYSPDCSSAWARFAPLNTLPTTAAVSVTVSIDRPSDGTATTWTVGKVTPSWGDMLLTTHGCVVAAAHVQFTGQHDDASGQTVCLTHP